MQKYSSTTPTVHRRSFLPSQKEDTSSADYELKKEACRGKNKRKVHKETFAPDRLAAVTQYCNNLCELFVGCTCLNYDDVIDEDTDWFGRVDEWLRDLVRARSTLELLVTPVFLSPELPFVKSDDGAFEPPLANLTRLYICKSNYLSHHLVEVAKSCKRLREVYISQAKGVKITDFIEFLCLVPNLEVLHVESMRFEGQSQIDPNQIGAILATLPSTSPRLRTLVLHHIQLPQTFPIITTESFPELRLLDLYDASYLTSLFLSNSRQPPSPRIQNLSIFLQNLRALEILHIDCGNLRLFDSQEFVWDILSPRVQIYTSQNFLSMGSAIAEAVVAGRLKYSIDWLNQEWAGLELDHFVRDWRFMTCVDGGVSDDDDSTEDDMDNQDTSDED